MLIRLEGMMQEDVLSPLLALLLKFHALKAKG